MKRVLNLTRGILSLVFLYALVGISCQKEAVPVKSGFQKTHGLTITQNGVFEKKLDITGWEKNEDLVILGHEWVLSLALLYPWQGEDSLDYHYDGLLWVNGRLVGGHYLPLEGHKDMKPEDILIVTGTWGRSYTPITPQGVVIDVPSINPEGLKQFPNLLVFRCRDLKGDSSLKVLDSLPQDLKLVVVCDSITNAGLEYLSRFNNIRWLSVSSLKINNRGFQYLSNLEGLKWLSIFSFWARFNLRHVKNLKELQLLHVFALMSNRGFRHLEGLHNLRGLSIGHEWFHATNAGLRHLESLTSLRKLHILSGYSFLNRKGFERLEKALPECKVTMAPPGTIY